MTAKPRREMSPRRVAKSVRSHQETMAAYGRGADGTPDVVTPGKGHVSIQEIGNGAPYRGDGWAGIEGVTNMEYKVVPGNPGTNTTHTLKRPRKGNK